MPPRFHEYRDKAIAAVDVVMAETVKLSFLKDSAVDPNRPAVHIQAVLRVGDTKNTNMTGGRAQSWRTRLAAGTAEIHIDRATYPDVMLREGDAVRALDRIGLPWFEVLLVNDRGHRLVAELGET
ncbi:hypothetical protein [Roseinatronobacter sp.]